VEAQAVQLYRIPLALHLRTIEEHRLGLRLTFPISFSSVRLERATDIGRFVKRLGVAGIVPGIELDIPVGAPLRLRPFVEAGLGRSTEGGGMKVLYGAGVRARVVRPLPRLRLTFGGSAMYRKLAASGDRYDGHSTVEGAVDAQFPLGFAIGQKPARGGPYVIVRGFNGLDLKRGVAEPFELTHQFEAGGSFSTEPDLRIWKVRLPWLGLGYRSGRVFSGLRFYMAFPF
jgi:hypothetical protein